MEKGVSRKAACLIGHSKNCVTKSRIYPNKTKRQRKAQRYLVFLLSFFYFHRCIWCEQRFPRLISMIKLKSRLCMLACASFLAVSTTTAHAEYEKNFIGEMETYTAVYEDTLVHLARDHSLGFVEVRAANPTLDPWIPGEGAEVILPKMHLLPDAPREGLVINLPEMRVYAYLNGDEAPYTYPLGIGREGLDTPVGKTTIVRKKEGPTWRPTPRMRKEDPELPAVVPPGPENPLGTHALYFGWPTYAMHGTNKPFGIGRRVSSGCIRLYPEDIVKFFGQVPVGTKVNVINQPIKVSWIDNELYLEAHPDLEQAIKMEEMGMVEQQKFTDEDMSLIIDRAGKYQDRLNWPRIRNALRERKGYPVRIAKYFEEDQQEDTSGEMITVQDGEGISVRDSSKDDINQSDDDAVVPKKKPKLSAVIEKPDVVVVDEKQGG